ncbi:hypothetical protein SAMN05216188_13174 [Lentzea xinjiangensis]|uniref:3-oxoacyl-[acyl-carrier protein] reductase n=1 Tax=Lentzea xinjiangensis TaxID=402600 RepID=A0A1H9W9A6_9PSEU|nr:hypothetical protein [Lentzea xinjiangensis]SES30404.1 hypothetical protein SAMN05216188_13174 [Lentzea xinjiangensis]
MSATEAGEELGAAGEPGDVAGDVEFLAGPAARHVTGQVITDNGGLLNHC